MREQKKSKVLSLYILAVAILLIFLHYLGIFSRAEDYFIEPFSYIQQGAFSFFTKLKYSFVNFQEAQTLQNDSLALKEEINRLTYENSQLVLYKQENESLRQTLDFVKDKDFDYLMVRVMGKDNNRPNAIIINKGKNDGVNEGYAVVVNDGIMVGKVIAAEDNVSIILLLTDKLSQVAVSTLEVQKTTGLATGEFGLSIKVELIPQDINVKEGDLFITSGLEKNIPRGFVLGKVNRIISQEASIFKSVTISPLIDYEVLSNVCVIIPK